MAIETQAISTVYQSALRRYARAVMGSQARGDAAVADLALDGDTSLSAQLRTLNASIDDGDFVARALLLRDYMGVSPGDIAAILNCPAAKLAATINAENSRHQKSLRILIVEAEPTVGQALKSIAEGQGHVVADIVPTCLKALDVRRQRPPDMVIADLQIADGSSGLEAARHLLGSFDVPVICLTAFPERLLTGKGLEPAFVVQKPYSPAAIAAMIRQAAHFAHKLCVAV